MTVRGNSTNSQHLQFCFCILLNIFGKRIALPCSSMKMKWNPPLHSRAEAWVPQISCWTAQILLWIGDTSTSPILQDWTNPPVPAGGGFSFFFFFFAAQQVLGKQMCIQHTCWETAGKELGCCWRGISHTRNLFWPANPSSKRGLLSWLCKSEGWSGLVLVTEALWGEMFNFLIPERKCLIKILYSLGILVFHQQGLSRCIKKKRLEYHKLLAQRKNEK